MTTKTDNTAEIGLHVFERAGLGKAPFRCIGVEYKTYQAHPGAPVQVGGSCDYCGTGISIHCQIKGADGRVFKVGSDCVAKTGDAGLLKGYKSHPAVRAHAKELRVNADKRVIAEFKALMADPETRAKLATLPAPMRYSWQANALEALEGAWAYQGAAGRKRVLKMVKAALVTVAVTIVTAAVTVNPTVTLS
jgi:hypothetical protein